MKLATILMIVALFSGAPTSAAAQAAWRAAQSGQTTQPEQSADQHATPAQAQPAPPAVQPAPAPCAAQVSAEQPSPCKTSAHKKHHLAKTVAASGTGPAKTIVRHGSTSDPNVQLGPGVSPQQAKQSQTAAQLLARTNANLTKIESRALNPDQQETVKQVKRYIDQSQTAASNGDVQRAYNLALKANLLSAELVRH